MFIVRIPDRDRSRSCASSGRASLRSRSKLSLMSFACDGSCLLLCVVEGRDARQGAPADLSVGKRGCLVHEPTHESQDFIQTLPLTGFLQLPRMAPQMEDAAGLEGVEQQGLRQLGPFG